MVFSHTLSKHTIEFQLENEYMVSPVISSGNP